MYGLNPDLYNSRQDIHIISPEVLERQNQEWDKLKKYLAEHPEEATHNTIAFLIEWWLNFATLPYSGPTNIIKIVAAGAKIPFPGKLTLLNTVGKVTSKAAEAGEKTIEAFRQEIACMNSFENILDKTNSFNSLALAGEGTIPLAKASVLAFANDCAQAAQKAGTALTPVLENVARSAETAISLAQTIINNPSLTESTDVNTPAIASATTSIPEADDTSLPLMFARDPAKHKQKSEIHDLLQVASGSPNPGKGPEDSKEVRREDLIKRYKDADYHIGNQSGKKSPRPKDGQKALGLAKPVPGDGDALIALCDDEFVVLRFTREDLVRGEVWYHGYVSTWSQLPQEMQNVLYEAKLVTLAGKIIRCKS
jgi:hypothetical protein